MTTIAELRRILGSSKTIAVVGLSPQWHRPSFFAAKYMQAHGYRIVPVNPTATEILGERCYPSVTAAAAALAKEGTKIDMIDCFRRTEDIPPIADEAIAVGAKCLWQQIGVKNEEAAAKAPRSRAGRRDGPLREDRACAPVRRLELGRREHEGDLVASPATTVLLIAWPTRTRTTTTASPLARCTRAQRPIR
jgi:hypothetical protein